MEALDESIIWKIIDIYFRDNPYALVRHHLDSYNDFFNHGIYQIFKEMNPFKLEVDFDEELKECRSKCDFFFGGKDGKQIYFGKPTIQDTHNHYMFPNECRLRNMTYGMTIHYDVHIEYTRILREDEDLIPVDSNGFRIANADEREKLTPSEAAANNEGLKMSTKDPRKQIIKMKLDKLYLGTFPIMLQSDFCILKGMPREMRYYMGECKNDLGGYFIIDGKEKTVISQEEFGNNMLNVYAVTSDERYLFSADIKSVSENVSKHVRTMTMKIVAPTKTYRNLQIVVNVPNVGQPVPLFILFRALGVLSDKEIISYCITDEISSLVAPYLDACIHDASTILTQYDAIQFIALLVKGRSISKAKHILVDFFLPHVGDVNMGEKAYFLGYMAQRILAVAIGKEVTTNRDSYKYKRLKLVGPLLKTLFREYYNIQLNEIRKKFETQYELNKFINKDVSTMVFENYQQVFNKNRQVYDGFRKAFKGNWGAYPHTKIIGVVQDLNRLSYNGMISHLRKMNLPLDASVKLIAPRILHGSQWGIVDPIDTPDGANIGIHKYLTIMALVTPELSREPMIKWILENTALKQLMESSPTQMRVLSKVFVNGHWIGGIKDPLTMVKKMRLYRRHGLLPIMSSIVFDHTRNTIFIYCDGGRLCRPIFYKDEKTNKFIFQEKDTWEKIKDKMMGSKSDIWSHIISGFQIKNVQGFDPMEGKTFFSITDLYRNETLDSQALLEYIDTNETESALIAMDSASAQMKHIPYTHCELHHSTNYGVMCNLINYVEHNPVTRNSFSCGQSKQACSMYSTNYQVRMDKMAVVLNNGQIPLVKTRYLEYINHEENPYGENAIVAIMCYTGYNVEDAILINEGAIQRGLFRTTYYTTYEAHEEKEVASEMIKKESLFTNIDNATNVIGTKSGYDYSKLNEYGLIEENTELDDKIVLIGLSGLDTTTQKRRDQSKVPKKGQLGIVDKAFMTDGEEGQRIAKVRVREERIPSMGDKFASRAGQKGTIGMVIPEENMPFTKDGIRPDMIINPHALPSRMTIGQMVECIVGKGCAMHGSFGDCTAFYSRENKIGMFGEMLTKHHFHSNGEEILYDGMSGKQLEASIFIGPTYYMRLKHMVKDKINYRARGPNTNLTRQPVGGRANDGGLRIGEMERDGVISHGACHFLQESMMERADKYQMAVCNHSGMIAIYNPAKNLMLSPNLDGPLKYSKSLSHVDTVQVQQLSKFGRDFSLIQVPYSLKLLIQELRTINVNMHIITEDNVNQFSNMEFSNNIDLLLDQKDATPKMVTDQIANSLKLLPVNRRQAVPQIPLHTPEEDRLKIPETTESPQYAPTSPAYAPNSPQYPSNSQSPQYRPANSNDSPQTPDYIPFPPTPDISEEPPINLKRWNPRWGPMPSRYELHYYEPKTPEGSPVSNPDFPPFAPTSPSDSLSNSDDYERKTEELNMRAGKRVHYRGDSKPDREWTIQKIGENMYTIDTTDLEHLKIEDSLKIVKPEDIYEPGNFVYARAPEEIEQPFQIQMQPQLQMQPQPQPQIQPQMQQQMYPSMQQYPEDPKINFAPVIKIFNEGNDMSQPDTGSPFMPMQQKQQFEQQMFEPKEEHPPENLLDFNKPLIVLKDT